MKTFRGHRTAIEVIATAVLGFVISLIALSPILSLLSNPWSGGDMLSTYVNSENWGLFGYQVGNHFGFPLGMDLSLFPGIDITQNSFAAVVNALTGNPYFGINLLLVLSFPLVSVLAYCSIRLTGLRGLLVIALAIAFTFIPFHFGRGLGHTYLGTMYAGVTAVILAQLIGMGKLHTFSRKKVIAVSILVLITAWSGVYYAAFGLILMCAAWLWQWTKQDSLKPTRQTFLSGIPIIATLVLVVVGFIPSLIALRADPPFATLGDRTPYESVIFAGILAMAILPAPISKLAILANYNVNVSDAFSAAPQFENSALGNYGTWVTFAALIVFALALFTRIRSHLGFLSMLLVVSILFFIPWGLNYLFAATLTPQIRAWNRMIPLILLLVILLVATILANMKFTQTTRPQIAVLAIATLILGVTAVESVWPWRSTYTDSAQEGEKVSQAAMNYTNAINTALPQNCAILQLPATVYPEQGPLGNFNDYDHFWQSITDSDKSWSYGAVKNTRAGAWMQQLPEVPGAEEIQTLARAGFCGIHLNTRAFVPPAQERIIADLTQRYGQPSATGGVEPIGEFPNWMFFTTDQNASVVNPETWSQNLTDYFLAPAVTTDPLTTAPRGSKDSLTWWWMVAPQSDFTISPINQAVPLSSITAGIRIPKCAAVDQAEITLTLTGGGQSESTTVLANSKNTIDVKLSLPQPTEQVSTLRIQSPLEGCSLPDFPYPQFAQVIDLHTR